MKEIQTPRSGEIYMGSDKGLYQIVCTAIDASNMQKLIIFQELQGVFSKTPMNKEPVGAAAKAACMRAL